MISYSQNFIKLKSEIAEIFSKAEFELEGAHSLDTLDWVMKIDPRASEALQIAALAHDIDRGIKPKITRKNNETYDDYKVRHATRSSQLITDLMVKYGYSEDLVKKTSFLIKNHEVGGSEEVDKLMDADSISFFSCNIEWYYKYKGLAETKDKIIFMYGRATTRAKKLIKNIKIKNKTLEEMCKEVFKRKF